MSAGSVSILLEIGSIKSYVTQSLQDFFDANLDYKKFSNEALKKFSLNIAMQRAKMYRTDCFNSLLYESEEKIVKNCTEKYILKNHSTTILQIDEQNEIIHKDTSFSYEYCNAKHIEEIKFSIRILANETNIEDISRNIFSHVRINGIAMDQKDIQKSIKTKNLCDVRDTEYDYEIFFVKKIETNDGNYSFDLDLSYDIPLRDLTQVYKITSPCKSLNHEFYIAEDSNWRLNAKAFTAFFCNEEEEHSNFEIVQPRGTRVKIEFNDWCLPGAGYVITPTKL